MKKIVLLTTTLLLSGCATIFSGSSQNINIMVKDASTSENINGVVCNIIDGSGGSSVLSQNPGSVRVSRGNGPVNINCQKSGYRQLNTSVGDNFNAVTLVNVLFWPGFLVDFASGAHKKYPSHYVVMMEKISSK